MMVDAVAPVPMLTVRLAQVRRKLATIHDLDELRAFRQGLSDHGILADPLQSEIAARMTALYAAQRGLGVQR